MKRDFNLIRDLLFYLEQVDIDEYPIFTHHVFLDGYTNNQVAYHSALLNDAGLILGEDNSSKDQKAYIIYRITFKGHDFIDAVRDQGVWKKVGEKAKKVGGALTFDLTKELAILFVRQSLGLDE